MAARRSSPTLPAEAGRIDLEALLHRLAELECNEVLLECGPTLAGDALARRLVDELEARVRDVRSGPDGLIYLLLPDRIVRVVPAGY